MEILLIIKYLIKFAGKKVIENNIKRSENNYHNKLQYNNKIITIMMKVLQWMNR